MVPGPSFTWTSVARLAELAKHLGRVVLGYVRPVGVEFPEDVGVQPLEHVLVCGPALDQVELLPMVVIADGHAVLARHRGRCVQHVGRLVDLAQILEELGREPGQDDARAAERGHGVEHFVLLVAERAARCGRS